MVVVLCDVEDDAALWLSARLRALGEPCALVTSGLLSFARHRELRLDRAGVRGVVDLGDGLVLSRPGLVVNRLVSPPVTAWQWARSDERDYAGAELAAFTLSWLAALPGVMRNRPTPTCLAGPSPHPLRTAVLARRAGLDVPDLGAGALTGAPHPLLEAAVRQPGAGARAVHLVVLDGLVVDPEGVARRAGAPLPADVAAAVTRFTTAVGAAEALVGLDVVVDSGRWWFAGLTPLPDLATAGDAVVRALLALGGRAAAGSSEPAAEEVGV